MNQLRCDFHIHTTHSDGTCSIQEVLSLYAQQQFDVIAITDHAVDRVSLKAFELQGGPSSVTREQFPEYLHQLELARQEAREKYNLHVIPGIELTNNTKEYHILALDIQEWIDPDLTVPEMVVEIHRQGGVAVACHPAQKEGIPAEAQGSFRHLYDNRERYKDIFDAWEVANRYHLFSSVSLMKVPFLANSDLHRPEHIFSWKTCLTSEKFNTAAVKVAIQHGDRAIFYHQRR
jgi:hypothetical protein